MGSWLGNNEPLILGIGKPGLPFLESALLWLCQCQKSKKRGFHSNLQLKSNLRVLQNLRSTDWSRRANLIHRIIAELFKICIGRNISNVGMILTEWDQWQWVGALDHSKLLYMEHKLEIPGHKICSWVCLMLGFSSLLLCGDTMPEFPRRVR